MTLPVTNLDDRSFQDIVDEAKRLIPKYCPEWTNHNLSDPGVALIELFAWMTEMTLFRLNQVPDVFYTHMLNLLGFEPFPATAARADLTFWLSSAIDSTAVVPVGTRVSTVGEYGATRVFTTLEDLSITAPTTIAALTSVGSDVYADVWDDLRIERGAVACFRTVTPGDCFYLGFEHSLAGNAIRMDITANVEGIGVVPDHAPLRWEIWQGEAWIPAKPYRDTTGGLNRNGNIVLLVPNQHEPLMLGGKRAYWLRARLLVPEPGQPTYRASPQIRKITVTSIGGTTIAEHSDIIGRELLGQSTGKPDQVFKVRNTPVLPRLAGETVTMTHGGVITDWTEVDDFGRSTKDDRHFVWNSTTGEVHFGPLIRYPNGVTRQHGALPPEGAVLAVSGYRTGGGVVGNVGSGTLRGLQTTIPYIAGVENIAPAIGGVDAETVTNAKQRGPQSLRTGGRAVTAEDFERIVGESDPSIARVRCLPPLEPDAGYPFPGGIGILRDASGRDRYVAGVFAQGTGFVQGLGMLLEGSGDDAYGGLYYAQGAAVHQGIALFADRDGSDRYDVAFPNQGGSLGLANDFAVAVFLDANGDDRFDAAGLSLGAGLANGLAVFANDGGDDIFHASSAAGFGSAQSGDVTGKRASVATIGLFVKARGGATYVAGGHEVASRSDGASDGDDTGRGPARSASVDEPAGRIDL